MKTSNIDGIILVSGGLDSTVLMYYLENKKENLIPLFINYGQVSAEIEFKRINKLTPKRFANNIDSINISDVYKNSTSPVINYTNILEHKPNDSDLLLPYRNLLLTTIAISYAITRDCLKIYSAFISSNDAKEIDSNTKYLNSMKDFFVNSGNVKLLFPFKNYSKYQVSKIGLSLNVPIEETFSCQINRKIHCGVCPNCVDRFKSINEVKNEIFKRN